MGVKLVIDQFYSIIRKYKDQKIFLVLSGPSCIGKGPLEEVFFNEIIKNEKLIIGKCILYVGEIERPKRVGESEGNPYYFKTIDKINTLVNSEPKRYIPFDVRGIKQMIDLNQVNELLLNNDIVFLEIYYTAIPLLRKFV